MVCLSQLEDRGMCVLLPRTDNWAGEIHLIALFLNLNVLSVLAIRIMPLRGCFKPRTRLFSRSKGSRFQPFDCTIFV